MIEKKCKTCEKKFEVSFYRKNKAKYCSHKCYAKAISRGKYPHCGFQKGHLVYHDKKGKTLEELYGKEKAKEIKRKSSKSWFKKGHFFQDLLLPFL